MCDKICYTKKEAQTALNSIKKMRHKARKETRIYFCNDCQAWHLTSVEKRNPTPSYKNVKLIEPEKWKNLLNKDNGNI